MSGAPFLESLEIEIDTLDLEATPRRELYGPVGRRGPFSLHRTEQFDGRRAHWR